MQSWQGDATWQQLWPSQWAWSRPYPCFNVRDLDTVDDGVWEHLLPALLLRPLRRLLIVEHAQRWTFRRAACCWG
jgi:hypothetical protein